ncbi:MAG: hypothetical protein R3C11_12235 [Planctomycetaceae bacterium]
MRYLRTQFIHLPLSSGLILTLDLESGRTVTQYVLPDDEARGLLFAAEGKLFCQGEQYLLCFATPSNSIKWNLPLRTTPKIKT